MHKRQDGLPFAIFGLKMCFLGGETPIVEAQVFTVAMRSVVEALPHKVKVYYFTEYS